MSPAEIADWAIASPLIDGVVFVPHDQEHMALPIRALAFAGGFQGYGKGLTQSAALASAVGEALERYAAAKWPISDLVLASYADLSQVAFDPRWLCLYRPEQYERVGFPYQPFHANKPIHWILGHWLDSHEAVYLPAFAVFLNSEWSGEALCQMTSNGLAAAASVEDANAQAALELYERDSFLLSWIAKCNAAPVQNNDATVSEMLTQCQECGAHVDLYLVAQGGPATVAVCVARGDGYRWPAVTLGLGSGSNAKEAVLRAVLEHGQTGPSLANEWRRERRLFASDQDIRTLHDQALYYCDPAHLSEFENWRSDACRVQITVSNSQIRIATVDLTPHELMDGPFRVVRAIARGLQPIHAGHGFERTHTERLEQLLQGRAPNPAPIPIC